MRKIIFTLGFVAATCSLASAQLRLGLYGLADFPQADFHQSGYNNGGGFGFSIMSGVLNSTPANPNPFVKVHFGGNLDINSFGSKHFENILLEGGDNRKGSVDVSDNSLGVNLAGRFILTNYKFRPYLEAFAGLRTYGTDETISPYITGSDYEDQTSNSIMTRATFAYGLGGGMLWRVNDWMDIETGVILSKGTATQYQLLSNVQQAGNEIHYNSLNSSNTNLFQVKLGVVFRLDKCECNSSNSQEIHEYHVSPPVYNQQHNTIRPNVRPGF